MFKRLITSAGALTFLVGLVTAAVPASVFAMKPSATTQITDCQDLQNINNNLSGSYQLANNIDCSASSTWNSNAGFVPIGDSSNNFTGSFDGQGFTISGLYINLPSTSDVGLFGYANEATIQNVGVVNASVTGHNSTGILVGVEYDSSISNDYSTGSVNGVCRVGGLIGAVQDGGTVTSSYSAADVAAQGYAGGFVGYAYDSFPAPDHTVISNSYALGAVSGSTGFAYGGFVGYAYSSIELSQDFAVGNVTLSSTDIDDVGGFIGDSEGFLSSPDVHDNYARGSVSGTTEDAGGFIGECDRGVIETSYSTGHTDTGSGGFSGDMGCDEAYDFWDTQTSGQTDSDGVGNGETGATTATMKTESTFTDGSNGFDFTENVWGISITQNDGYPYLPSITYSSGNGVTSAVENAAPNNGDANGDGLADSEQANVASLIDPVSNKYVSITASDDTAGNNCGNSDLSNVSVSSVPNDGSYTFPAGVASFTIDCDSPGATVTITQYFYGNYNPATFVLIKYNATTKAYSTVPGATFTSLTIGGQAALKATYQITDGGALDEDGTANGVIVDPVGPATVASSSGSTAGAPNTGYGEPVSSWQSVAMYGTASLSILAIGLSLRKLYKSSSK